MASLLTLMLHWATISPCSAADLLFSEYIEGSSNNKALEIFNGTGAAVDLSAGGYVVQMYFNGSATATLTLSLTGTVANGDVFVLAQSSANASILAQADQTNGAAWFNGNDAVVLRKNGASGSIIDSIGQVGFNPGTEWGTGLASTADNTLRRKTTIAQGDTNPSDVFNPSLEWDGFAQDTFGGLGSHTSGVAETLTLSSAPSSFSEAAGSSASTGTVTRSGDTTSSLTVNLASSDSTEATVPVSVIIPSGQASVTFAIQAIDDALVDGPQSVTLTASAIAFGTGTTTLTVTDDDVVATITKIHDIQGSALSAPPAYLGTTRTIEGVVVASFPGSAKLSGFYVQEEDGDSDADAATSEGIFVFDPTGLYSGSEGRLVRVTGTVAEFTSTSTSIAGTANSSLTELSAVTSVFDLGPSPLPSVASILLPVTAPSALERYEGMRVAVSSTTGTLTVTETFKLGRFGQVGLSGGARLDQFTQSSPPSVSGYAQYLADLQDNYIILDDGSTVQNPDPAIHARGGQPLSAVNTLRGGDTIASISGVLDERFEGYRVQTLIPAVFQPSNPRASSPSSVGGSLRVASANLLNFFNGNGIDANHDGFVDGGFPTSRGADTAAEFKRQLDKTVEAVLALNADVFGYNEMENDGYGATSAVQQLVDALNARTAPGTYALVVPPASALNGAGGFGGDEITVGFLYKPGSVRLAPGTTVQALTTGIFAQDTGNRVQRPPLTATFERLQLGVATGETLTVVVNHFKSKGSAANLAGDADQGDGQGLSNATRSAAAAELAAWLATRPTGTSDADYLILGDLNSYRMEDPITILTSAGYTSLFGPESYSYQFNGQWGSLDHALATPGLASQVTGATKWHINSDEPVVLDYNVEFKSANQINSFYNMDPFRTSDHDPILVELNLRPANLPPIAGDYWMGCQRDLSNTLSFAKLLRVSQDPDGDTLSITAASPLSLHGGTVSMANALILYTAPLGFTGIDSFTYTVTDPSGLSDDATVSIVVQEFTGNGSSVLGVTTAANVATVRFAGIPGVIYDIEACDDLGLQVWNKIGQVVAGAYGLFEFADTEVGVHPLRFYRSRAH